MKTKQMKWTFQLNILITFGFSMKISQKSCMVCRGIDCPIHIRDGFTVAFKIFRTGQCWKWDHFVKSTSNWLPKWVHTIMRKSCIIFELLVARNPLAYDWVCDFINVSVFFQLTKCGFMFTTILTTLFD